MVSTGKNDMHQRDNILRNHVPETIKLVEILTKLNVISGAQAWDVINNLYIDVYV